MSEKRKASDWTIQQYHKMVFKRIRCYSNPDGIWGNNDSSFEGIVESVTSYTTCENKRACHLIVSSNKLSGYSIHPLQWYMIEVFHEPISIEELLTHPSSRLRDLATNAIYVR
jgi:hypothetical protein